MKINFNALKEHLKNRYDININYNVDFTPKSSLKAKVVASFVSEVYTFKSLNVSSMGRTQVLRPYYEVDVVFISEDREHLNDLIDQMLTDQKIILNKVQFEIKDNTKLVMVNFILINITE